MSRSAFATISRSTTISTSSSSSTSYNSDYISVNGTPVVLNFYSDLALIIDEIIPLLYNFSIGNFEFVTKTLTKTLYYNLSIKLLSIRQDPVLFPEYESTRICINRALEGLQQSIILHKKLESEEIQLQMTKERADILDNMDKLKAFINSLGGSVSLFQDVTVTAVAAQLKPEIAIYLKLYGYPEGGVFDMENLANAINIAKIQNSSLSAP